MANVEIDGVNSKVYTDQVDPKTSTTLTLGTSGDTITVPTGAGLTVTDEVKTNKVSPATGTAFALGDSGDTFTVPSGATIVNSGTATGFGGGKVLQIQSMTYGTQQSSNATTYENSSVTDSITPASTSNDILVLASVPYRAMKTGGSTVATRARGSIGLFRGDKDGTKLTDGSFGWNSASTDGSTGYTSGGVATFSFLDSPSTTSAQSYTDLFSRN